MNRENRKTSESHRFRLDLTDKLNLKCPKKNMALTNISIYYTWKNIKSEFESFYFNLKWYFWFTGMMLFYCRHSRLRWIYHQKNTKLWQKNPPIQIYPNKIKKRIVFKIKTGYKLEQLTPETMRLLGSTKKMLIKIKTAKTYQN